MNQQMTNGSTSSPPPKALANGASMVTPDSTRNPPIDLDGCDDASLSNVSMNGDKTDSGGTNNASELMPKSGFHSTKDNAMAGGDFTSKNPSTRELVNSPKLVAQSTDDPTGDEDMVGDNTAGGFVNGLVQVPKSVSDSTAIDDDLARIDTEIGGTQHLIEISNGDALDIAQEDLLQIQQLLEEKKKTMASSGDIADGSLKDTEDDMAINENAGDLRGKPPADPSQRLGYSVIGGTNTVDQLTKQLLNNNTAANAISSLRAVALNNMVTPIWTYSQYQPRRSSISAIPNSIRKKIKAFKNVRVIQSHSHSHSTKFQGLWSKSSLVTYSSTTPVLTIMDFISVLDKKKEDWTKTVDARNLLHMTFIALSKTSPEVFGGDWKQTGELHPSPPASLWTAAIKVLGCSFDLKVQIKLTSKGILKSDMKELKVGGKKLTFDVASISIKTKAGGFLTGKVPRQPFPKKI